MADPLRVPIAPYAPDLPPLSDGSDTVLNVYPRTPTSYGAIPSPAAQYNALGSRCQGAAAFRDSLGNTFIFSGDLTDLFLIKAGDATWENVSLTAGGYTSTNQVWRFAYFNGDVIATNFNNDPQYYQLIGGTAAFAALGGSPPRGKYIAVVKNSFVVFANTYDVTNGNMPQRVWWSAAGDDQDWPILGTDDAAQKQSGATDLLGPQGVVQGIAADLINADALIFQEYAIRRMVYSGPPSTFSFLPVENARGCLAPDSIVVQGGIAYYWGQDGIYACDGATSSPIGANRVDKTVFTDVDMGNIARVVGVADPLNKLIWWAYPSTQNVNGNPDKMLIYNWQLDRFSLANINCETVFRIMTIGYTVDQLSTIFGYTVDTVPAPFDSPVWLGGRMQIALFDTAHTLNFLSGTPLAVTVDSSEMQPVPGRRVFVRNTRPLVEGLGALPSVSIGHRERLQDAKTYSTASSLNAMGMCPLRASGRYITVRTTIPAGQTAWTNIAGVELDIVAQGVR